MGDALVRDRGPAEQDGRAFGRRPDGLNGVVDGALPRGRRSDADADQPVGSDGCRGEGVGGGVGSEVDDVEPAAAKGVGKQGDRK